MFNKELLKESKRFCLIPWIHMHTWPNGNTYMCCTSDPQTPLGVLSKENSLKHLWNSPQMKKNRLAMLNDEYVPECSRCYEIEEFGGNSLRTDITRNFFHHIDKVDETLEDGTVEKMNLPYVDFRFSNFCNLRCRTCGPELSSKWALDHNTLLGKPAGSVVVTKPDIPREIFWEQIEEIIPTIESVYFAGGEPLLMEEHYKFLNLLIEHNKTNINLIYNTNLSNVVFKNTHICDYWKKFDKVVVLASLDSWGPRAEYIRKGLTWSKAEKNIRDIKTLTPHVEFIIGVTLSVFNFATLVEYYDYMIDNNFISYDNMNINIVTDPLWYKANVVPLDFRLQVAEKYQEKIDFLTKNKLCGKTMLDRWELAKNYITAPFDAVNHEQFISLTKHLDKIRKESFTSTFPELSFMFHE
jgi:sulfatase maturation enzyme AslB (radical SAM superfamily)